MSLLIYIYIYIYTNILYEDCRCNVASIESCLTDLQLKYTCILPLILFYIRNLYFKRHSFIKLLSKIFSSNFYWIFSIFLFFCLLMFIYRCSHHYSQSALFLSCLDLVLYFCCAASRVIS